MEYPKLRPVVEDSQFTFQFECVNALQDWKLLVERQPQDVRALVVKVFSTILGVYSSSQFAMGLSHVSRIHAKELKKLRAAHGLSDRLTFGAFAKFLILSKTIPCEMRTNTLGTTYVIPQIAGQTLASRLGRGETGYAHMDMNRIASGEEAGPPLSEAGVQKVMQDFFSQSESVEKPVENFSPLPIELTEDAIAVNPHEKPAFLSPNKPPTA